MADVKQPAAPDGGAPAAPETPAAAAAPATPAAAEQEISQEDARRYKAIVDSLEATMSENPELEEVVSLLVRGDTDFVEAVAAVLTPEELQAATDGAEDGTALAQRVAQRKEKKIKQAELDKNIQQSFEAIEQYCTQMGYDEQKRDNFVKNALEWFQIWADGKITVKEMAQLDKMTSYDTDVAASYEDGKVDGQAQKAKAIKADKNAAAVTAGIGKVGSGAGQSLNPQESPKYGEDDELSRAADRIAAGEV